MKKLIIAQSDKEFYTSNSGLALAGLCLNRFCSLPAKAKEAFPVSAGTNIEVEGWWTLLDIPPKDVIRLYEDHGTSEQFHSEIKTDLDLERLPSGKFATNALILTLGGLAYNILTRHRPDRTRGREDPGAPSRQTPPDQDGNPGTDVLGRSTGKNRSAFETALQPSLPGV